MTKIIKIPGYRVSNRDYNREKNQDNMKTNSDFILDRNSFAKLSEPAPVEEVRERIFRSALRAPDHGMLKPWRFLVIEGEARKRFGELLADALKADKCGASDGELEKARNNPLRAPLLVVAIAKPQDHPKIPVIEQLLSAGCTVHQMLLAAEAEGFGGIWRTGPLAYNQLVKDGLNLTESEQIIGFLYLGTPTTQAKTLSLPDVSAYFSYWK